MAKMVSLKLSKKQSKAEISPPKSEGPEYPYGSRVDLESEVLKKLGLDITAYPPGTECRIEAVGYVTRTSDDKNESGKDRQSMCIQMTEILVEPSKKAKKAKAENEHLKNISGPTGDDYKDED